MTQPSIVLIGARGHGASHLATIRRLQEQGAARLVGVCDPTPVDVGADVVWGPDLPPLLAALAPDITVIATPIHTHAGLATLAAEAGSHVLLEKPPTSSLSSYEALVDTVERCGVACQVGFQDLGSHALPAMRALVADGTIGEVVGVGGAGRWVRSEEYFHRTRWAGRRRLDGVDVVDGALTNPFAHAVAEALWLAGAPHADDVASVETELLRANDIEADDTSCVRIVTRDGLPIVVAATLAAEENHDPWVVVHGTQGRLRLRYKRHELTIESPAGTETVTFEHTGLLDNLLAHVAAPDVDLTVPLQRTGAFMRVLEAVRLAPPPRPIAAAKTVSDEHGRRRLLSGIDEVVTRSAEQLQTFSELGMPWARPPRRADDAPEGLPQVLHRLCVGDIHVGEYRSGHELDPTLAPRPHLHPLTTLAGTPVTDSQPGDHAWHLGCSIGIQDVDGINFWGGRTYLPEQGYVWRDDHGRVEHVRWELELDDRVRESLTWRRPDGDAALHEQRWLQWHLLRGTDGAWLLHLRSTLSNSSSAPVALGSPATNGRAGAGYGGIFWRFPLGTRPMDVRSPGAVGEDGVHGRPAAWVACRGDAGTTDRAFTVILCPADPETADQPWFVRVTGYPGVCASYAFTRPLLVPAGGTITRSVGAVIVDGHVPDDQLDAIARTAVEDLTTP